MKLRVKFSKHGVMKFIGHLDVMRYFQKAIRRAGIDVAYSTGFSPHQIMSFAAPLGVGLESNGEYMDIEVNSDTGAEEFVLSLNAQMADGIKVLSVKLLPENAGNAMASVAAAKYTIRFREGLFPNFMTDVSLNDFCRQDEIIITKKTKKSESVFDMKPFIYECYLDTDENAVIMTVDASSSGNIKPSMVIGAFYEKHGQTLDEYALLITREETYMNTAQESEDRDLKPLDFIGTDF